jgi:hypothetical protein
MVLCLSTGTVSVTAHNHAIIIYSGDEEVPFPLLSASFKVSEIWPD